MKLDAWNKNSIINLNRDSYAKNMKLIVWSEKQREVNLDQSCERAIAI